MNHMIIIKWNLWISLYELYECYYTNYIPLRSDLHNCVCDPKEKVKIFSSFDLKSNLHPHNCVDPPFE